MEIADIRVPTSFLKLLAVQKQLSEGEVDVLCRVMMEETIDQIADELNTSASAIHQRLAQIYSKFDIEGKGPGKLPRLKLKIETEYVRHDINAEESILECVNFLTKEKFDKESDTSLFSKDKQPSNLLKDIAENIKSDDDIERTLIALPEYLLEAIYFLDQPQANPQKRLQIFKKLILVLETFFEEQEKVLNYIPMAETMKLNTSWNSSNQESNTMISCEYKYQNNIV